MRLTVCLLTFNSARLLREVVPPLREIADEFVVLDSGSKDDTLEILRGFGIGATHRAYSTHGEQMNAVGLIASGEIGSSMDLTNLPSRSNTRISFAAPVQPASSASSFPRAP